MRMKEDSDMVREVYVERISELVAWVYDGRSTAFSWQALRPRV